MPQGPIQVVLNTDVYISPVQKPRVGGSNTDFYKGLDRDFVTHRDNLVRSVTRISESLVQNPYTSIGYVKVRLIRDAMAKSHRPERALFNDRQHCRIVGNMRRGELLVEMDGRYVGRLIQAMNEAESSDRIVTNKKGEQVVSPSRNRSEVGAIAQIELLSGDDKCSISPQAAVDWVQNRYGFIIVELFKMPPADYSDLPQEEVRMYESFCAGLEGVVGVQVGKVSLEKTNALTISIRQNAPTRISFTESIHQEEVSEPCAGNDAYVRLMTFLKAHPLVKKISLSPNIQSILPAHRYDGSELFVIPNRDSDHFPIVGIVDGGISDLYSQWTNHRWTLIDPADRDNAHGTFISGLLVNGKALNPTICKEEDGCILADVCVLPRDGRWGAYYPFGEFLTELENAVRDAVDSIGVRIFNFSMNSKARPRTIDEYGYLTRKLDELAVKLDVVFIISAGNLGSTGGALRSRWNADPAVNVTEIQSRTDDIVTEPGESIRNITVGALNPDMVGLAYYSRKGKASELAVKPDFVYPSGSGIIVEGVGEGLYSVNESGLITTGSGTSYAAPLVAKTMAMLNTSIEGRVSRETLLALMYHNAYVPDSFKHKAYKPVLEDMIGYGVPKTAAEIFDGDSHSITLVFSEKIRKGMILSFPFTWPPSLIKNGKCIGYVRMTLVSTPNVDYNYGAESVRENVEAHLRIIKNNGKHNQVEILYKDSNVSSGNGYEWELIEQDHKWQPIKVYERSMPRGIENPGQFYLEVDYLSRTDQQISPDGVPFTVIMTISDIDGEAPVYDEMRNIIIANGVQIADIQTAARITPRV